MIGGFFFVTGVQGLAPDVRFLALHAVRECYIKYVTLLVCFYIGYDVRLRNSSKLYVALLPWGFGGFPRKGLPERIRVIRSGWVMGNFLISWLC